MIQSAVWAVNYQTYIGSGKKQNTKHIQKLRFFRSGLIDLLSPTFPQIQMLSLTSFVAQHLRSNDDYPP